jgi:hypothetical protein
LSTLVDLITPSSKDRSFPNLVGVETRTLHPATSSSLVKINICIFDNIIVGNRLKNINFKRNPNEIQLR